MKYSFRTFSRRAFTLIELLVVVAIIAILAVVVVLTLNPAQLLAQSRDANRVSDMSTLNSAIALYQTDFGGTSALGTSSIISVSLPDPAATTTAGTNCSTMGLPTLPSSYSYDCSASSTYKNANALGWIPLNFNNISAGSPFSSVPTDPTNTSSSRLYYTYTTNGSNYEVTANMESAKYKLGGSNDVISSDGGPLASLYEKGTKLGLEPLDYGDTSLVGYWPMDEGTGSYAYDYSGTNATGTWGGTLGSQWGSGKMGGAGSFGGANYLSIGRPTALLITGPLTVSAWINANSFSYGRIIANSYQNSTMGPITFEGGGSNNMGCYSSLPGGVQNAISATGTISTGSWNHVVCEYTGSALITYINGTAVVSTSVIGTFSYTQGYPWVIGAEANSTSGVSGYFSGSIDAVRIYNRALSAGEIKALYTAGK